MIRVVLAVVLATALVGVSLPVIADAGADRTAAALDADAARIDRAAALVANDPAVPPGTAGARRVLSVRLPGRSIGSAAAGFVAVCPAVRPGDLGRVVYALDGRAPVVRRLSVPVDRSVGPVVFRDPGAHRLVLEHVRVGGRAVVRATAGGGASTGSDPRRTGGSNTGKGPPAPCDSSTASGSTAPTATTEPAAAGRGSRPSPAPPTAG